MNYESLPDMFGQALVFFNNENKRLKLNDLVIIG